ncbi:HD domain-containing phosphohydrolase [Castellaniella sp. UC4442_H9]|jgi:response regulator RpfG family c-di-GMP phosphodiesterase|nr:HD domain-containing phosphohydrolase [Castellaniella sp.]
MNDDAFPAGSATLLLVDDEVNVVKSLHRALKNHPYRILVACSGEEALAILERQDVDVVISDSRMPGMDGPTLLSHVQDRWPDRMRIMLTGYSDMKATIRAINDGNIYRYIGKPWDDFELVLAIEQTLSYKHLKTERARLQQLTQQQNLALQEANATLEARVLERTQDLARTAELLSVARDHLHRSYITATEVFSSLINQRLPPSRQTNQQVIALVRAFCRAQALPQELTDDLAMAAAFYNLGKLTWTDTLIALPPERMNREQRGSYRQYPEIGESLLMALEPAQEAARFVRHHQERWDGAGFPDGLSGHAIPLGARILKMAVDFVEMQMGMVLPRKLALEEVLSGMPRYAGRLYDPALCAEFVDVASKMQQEEAGGQEATLVMDSAAIEPGMVMVRDLCSAGGTLLLKAGTVLTEKMIEKLQAFEHNEGKPYTFYTVRPESEDGE